MTPAEPSGPGASGGEEPSSPEAQALARENAIAELKLRLRETEKKLEELSLPWWRRTGAVAVVTGILAAAVPVTEVVKGWVESRRARVADNESRIETVRSGYLDRSLKQGTNQERTAILRFVLATSGDEALTAWAKDELALVKQQIEDERRLQETQAEREQKAREAVVVAAALPRAQAPVASSGPTPEEQRAREELKRIKARADELQQTQERLLAELKLPPASAAQRARPAPVILWVDDNPANNAGLRDALEAAGARVVTSTSTEDAERRLALERVDLVISDMGRHDRPSAGYELLDALRARGVRTPFVIFATNAGAPANRAEAKRRDANGSTDRPSELLRIIGSYVDLEPQLAARR